MWLLIEITWGLTSGALIGAGIGADKDAQEKIAAILKEKGIANPEPANPSDDWYEKLPLDVKRDIGNVVKQKLQTINWFSVTFIVSALVFAVVGFLCGYLSRAFIPIGLLVLLSFLVNNPIVRFPHAKVLASLQKSIIVLSQFGFVYIFGYLGAFLSRKRDKSRSGSPIEGN